MWGGETPRYSLTARTVEAVAVWIYDLRTNKSFTLKETPLVRADLDEFVPCYEPEKRAHTSLPCAVLCTRRGAKCRSARRKDKAAMVSDGLLAPDAGKTELSAT